MEENTEELSFKFKVGGKTPLLIIHPFAVDNAISCNNHISPGIQYSLSWRHEYIFLHDGFMKREKCKNKHRNGELLKFFHDPAQLSI